MKYVTLLIYNLVSYIILMCVTLFIQVEFLVKIKTTKLCINENFDIDIEKLK